MIEEMLTAKQAAGLAGVSKYVIYRMINEGVLPAYRPTPRRTRLLRSEVLAAFAVPVVPRPKLPVAQPVADEGRTASAAPGTTARHPSRRSPERPSSLKIFATAYDHLLQPKRS
jgi:excisionase family DNA binding protein